MTELVMEKELREGEEMSYQGKGFNIPLNFANLNKAKQWLADQGKDCSIGGMKFIDLEGINPYSYVWEIIFIYITGMTIKEKDEFLKTKQLENV